MRWMGPDTQLPRVSSGPHTHKYKYTTSGFFVKDTLSRSYPCLRETSLVPSPWPSVFGYLPPVSSKHIKPDKLQVLHLPCSISACQSPGAALCPFPVAVAPRPTECQLWAGAVLGLHSIELSGTMWDLSLLFWRWEHRSVPPRQSWLHWQNWDIDTKPTGHICSISGVYLARIAFLCYCFKKILVCCKH